MSAAIPDGGLIDFHSHYYEQSWSSFPAQQAPTVLQRAWPLLTNIEDQLAVMDSAGIAVKVVSAPTGAIVPPGQTPSPDLIKRINDRFAELQSSYPHRLLTLATVDAFQGEDAAREAERAIQQLKLGGLCVDCSHAGRYLDKPEARAVFAVAAQLNVPVFVHPVSPSGLTERLAPLGHTGILMARGTENAASLLALLRSGIFDKFPNLKIVFPMIGVPILFFAGLADLEYGREEDWHGTKPSLTRQRLYVDTMGFDVATIRFAIDLLGAEHILFGSDWPIMPLMSDHKVEEVLTALFLSEDQKKAIRGGNTLRLLT